MSSENELILARLDELMTLIQGLTTSPWFTRDEAATFARCSKRKIEQLCALKYLPDFPLDPSLDRSPRLIHRKHLTAFLLTGKNVQTQRLSSEERKLVDALL